MLRLCRFSEKVGLIGTAVFLCFCLFAAAIVIDFTNQFFVEYRSIATAIRLVLLVFVALGSITGLSLLKQHIDYWQRGYRVRWLNENHWAYEERGSEQKIVPYIRKITWEGYPASCTIRITDDAFPEWPADRRNEIVKRIAICHGSEQGGKIEVIQSLKEDENQ